MSSPEMRVIGAGLGRTGTKSLQAALNILGYTTYHFPPPEHAAHFAAMAMGRASREDTLAGVCAAGFDASCDQPMADLYREQAAMFPEARVVLTVRDAPEQWERSYRVLLEFIRVQERPFSLTYPTFIQWVPFFRDWKTMRGMMGMHLGLPPGALIRGWVDQPDGWLAKQYEKHNAQVMASIAPERMLVFNVKEGWGPLCAFLGKPVPDVPFPRVNETAEIRRARNVMVAVSYSWIPALALVGVVAWRAGKAAMAAVGGKK